MLTGQDWSGYQPSRPSTTGIDFAIIKATEGRSYTNPRMDSQAATARTAGLVVGFYHFLHPANITDQARYFVEKAASLSGDILACDWETTSSGTHASSADKDAFLREVKRLRPGHRVLLYCNTDFWLHRDTSSYAGDGLWIARYGVGAGRPGIEARWLIHQYTSSPLDTNVAQFATRSAMRAWASGTPEEDPVALTTADAKKVWTVDFIQAPVNDPSNPTWAPNSYLRDTNLRVRALQATAAAQGAAIQQLAKAVTDLAANTAELDPDALIARIEQAIEAVTIHLDVPDA